MATNNSSNQRYANNADGWQLGGGTTVRTLTLTGGDTTITGSGSVVITFPTSTATMATLALSETLTNKILGATTLAGAISGAGNQINNVVIGASNPLAGNFTVLTATGSTFAMTTAGMVATVTGGVSTVAGTFIDDTSSAAEPALIARNNTNFAWTGNTGILQARLFNGSDTGVVLSLQNAGSGDYLRADSNFRLAKSGKASIYAAVTSSGWGVPAIYGSGRTVGAVGAITLTTYTVGAADGSFEVSANVLVTTATAHNFIVTCTYTDEGNTSRTLTLTFSNIGGTLLTLITNTGGTVPYEGIPLHIRAKASTSITLATANGGGTNFTTVVYNAEGNIRQIA